MDIIFPYNPRSIFEKNDIVISRIIQQIYFLNEKDKNLFKDYSSKDLQDYISQEDKCFLYRKEKTFQITVKHSYNHIDVRKYISDYTGNQWFEKGAKLGQSCKNKYCIRSKHLFDKSYTYLYQSKKLKNKIVIESPKKIIIELPEEEFNFLRGFDPENSTQ